MKQIYNLNHPLLKMIQKPYLVFNYRDFLLAFRLPVLAWR